MLNNFQILFGFISIIRRCLRGLVMTTTLDDDDVNVKKKSEQRERGRRTLCVCVCVFGRANDDGSA